MTAIAILPDAATPASYRAISGQLQGVGKTAGEALDALVAQLGISEAGTLLVVQPYQADAFFTAEQQQRLQELMDRWRAARDSGNRLAPDERTELDALVQAELRAATAQTDALSIETQGSHSRS